MPVSPPGEEENRGGDNENRDSGDRDPVGPPKVPVDPTNHDQDRGYHRQQRREWMSSVSVPECLPSVRIGDVAISSATLEVDEPDSDHLWGSGPLLQRDGTSPVDIGEAVLVRDSADIQGLSRLFDNRCVSGERSHGAAIEQR